MDCSEVQFRDGGVALAKPTSPPVAGCHMQFALLVVLIVVVLKSVDVNCCCSCLVEV